MRKPIIGVMGNVLLDRDIDFLYAERLYVNLAYIRAVEQNGGIPLLLSARGSGADYIQALSHCDGLLLPGGVDITPTLYGQEPHTALGSVMPEQDAAWTVALTAAKEQKLPVLGICRGMQFMCVFQGGTLYQDLSQRDVPNLQHNQLLRRTHPIHCVTLTQGSALAHILGETSVSVNSLHHQAVQDLGVGLLVSGRTQDGIIEAVESVDGRWLGVQWHPEELLATVPCMNRLFAYFCEMCTKSH